MENQVEIRAKELGTGEEDKQTKWTTANPFSRSRGVD